MTSKKWLHVKEIFLEALERKPDERGSFLEEACGGDAGLKKEVEDLLSSHEESGHFMELPDSTGPFHGALQNDLTATRIGRFLLEEVISFGGMGTVYRAVQEQPQRTVAVKVMREGLSSRSALRRFEYEAQLLARLRHPGIAQVYDAGTHRDGEVVVPYFATEYIVAAKPVSDYAKEKKLGTRERIELFAQVCDAVHHGHQKGIIHRDLKPSNILVDAQGQVKIIPKPAG